MSTVRCSICLLRFQKLKRLYIHYAKFHSKIKIIKKLLILNSKQTFIKTRKRIFRTQNSSRNRIKKCYKNNKIQKNESFIINDNIRIFCGDQEIISIGDEEHSVKLSFNNAVGNPERCHLIRKTTKVRKREALPTAAKTKTNNKRKTKKKKPTKKQNQNYHINITKLKDTVSLDEQNGVFYTCHCRENGCHDAEQIQKCDLRLVTSDTESCSETLPLEESRLFCNKCGSGYKTETELSEHMYVHEPFCRLCNSWFPNEFIFKQHMQLHKIRVFACHICNAEFPFKETLFSHLDCHMEEKVIGDVLDMEEDYSSFRVSFLNNNYTTTISSIMCYLKDRPDMYYYSYKFMKTICDICYKEVTINEYERHLEMFHSY